MTIRDEAIAKAAVFSAFLKGAEKELKEAIELAEGEGAPGVLDALLEVKRKLDGAHRKAALLAIAVDAVFDGGIEQRSGGDDKPPKTPTPPGGGN